MTHGFGWKGVFAMAATAPTEIPAERDAQGFLLHAGQWSEDIAAMIAGENGIADPTRRHWQVIGSVRQAFVERGSLPWLRMVSRVSGVPIEELYRLFPGGPSRLVAKIAGIPKLRSCI
jgi:TusE/DsrC/DsvC family sulfur relay protein